MMKKLSLFLTAFLTATMASAWNGSGTADAPYLIESIDDMTTLVNAIGNGNNFDNVSFKLMADLDYSAIPVNSDGINFKTVGGNGRFWGNFNGNEHTISGIITDRSPFNFIYYGRTLKGLTIRNATINCSENTIGGLVGENAGTVENCHVENDVSLYGNGYHHIGGLVGNNVGTITMCTSAASITGGGDRVGGIAGYQQRIVSDCAYLGTTVEGTKCVGAIAGYWDEGGSMTGNVYLSDNLRAYSDYYGNAKDEPDAPHQTYYAVTAGENVSITYNSALIKTIGEVEVYEDGLFYKNTHYCVSGTTLALAYIAPSEDYVLDHFTCSGTGASVSGSTLTVGTADVTVNAVATFNYSNIWAGEGTGSLPWMINTIEDWNKLAEFIENGERFIGKKFRLGNSISVSKMVGTADYPFAATFDGNGKTLTVNINSTDEGAAPFHYISLATINNLTIDGTINGGNYSAGLVGFALEEPGYQNVDNAIKGCTVKASITTNGAYCGGIVGKCTSYTTFDNLVFDGTIRHASTAAGAILGWGVGGNPTFTSCLAKGTYDNCNAIDFINVENSRVPRLWGGCFKLFSNGQYGVQVFPTYTNTKLWRKVTAADNNTYYHSYVEMNNLEETYLMYNAGLDYSLEDGDDMTIFVENQDYTATIKNSNGNVVSYFQNTGMHTLTITGIGTGRLAGSKTFSFNVVNGIDLEGEGTADDPYYIYEYKDLLTFANAVNHGFATRNKIFNMNWDIYCAGKTIPAIGTREHPFQGYFSGIGCYIYDFKVGSENANYQGLFGYVGEYGCIEDLTLVDAQVTGAEYVGVFAGYCKGAMKHCFSIDNTVTGTSHLGAIAGGGNATYTDVFYLRVPINGQQSTGTACNGTDPTGTGRVYELDLDGVTLIDMQKKWSYECMTVYENGMLFYNYKEYDHLGFMEGTTVNLKLNDPNSTARYLKLTDKDGNNVEVNVTYNADGTYSFAMPPSDIVAKNIELNLALIDGEDNTSTIEDNENIITDVTLEGRTFYKDGNWNTLCLPFNLEYFTDTPLQGAEVRELDGTTSLLDGITLVLNFNKVTAIKAGKPYLVKWEDNTFPIGSKEEWDTFASRVNAGETTLNAHLTADITEAVTTMVGSPQNMYAGTFDGKGHTLNVDIENTSDQGTAPFRYIANAKILNVKTTGKVKGTLHCAGLVGFAWDNSTNTIDNCEVYVDVTTVGSHCGGILGHGKKSTTTISNSLFSGNISEATTAIGIIYGWGDNPGYHIIKNCLANGTYSGEGIDMVRVHGGYIFVTNCYKNTSEGQYGTQTSATGDELAALLGQDWQVVDDVVKPVVKYFNVINPKFKNVVISSAKNDVPTSDGVATFCGLFKPLDIDEGDNTVLYLGADNKLYFPSDAMTINSFRAYFQLNNGITALDLDSGINAFVLNFGGEETSVSLVSHHSPLSSDAWYSIDGKKLVGKPTTKGIYINNGHKIVVK